MKLPLFFGFVVLLSVFATAQGPATETSQKAQAAQTSRDERDELRNDLQKMRGLIELMQKNLAATATGETPLKRQFQLEIEMWQLLIKRMERRLEPRGKEESQR